ncbi:MAG: hypothetical protein KDK36_04075 [Leptospiraceae bacterium]|nr:hypothetical protein [Leptospiraceae bacterium]
MSLLRMLQSYIPERSQDEYFLMENARKILPQLSFEELNHEILKQLTKEHGIEMSSAIFFTKLIDNSKSSKFIDLLNQTKVNFSSLPKFDGEVWILPAGFYRDIPEFDGDGELIRKIGTHFGLKSRLIELDPKGTISANSEIIIEELSKDTPENLFLFSISKGTADLRIALEKKPELQSKIKSWVSIGGLFKNNPLADKVLNKNTISLLLQKTVLQILGIPMEFISEFSSKTGILKDEVNIIVKNQINVIAVPLPSHMQGNILKRYKILAHHGPNDGYSLLLDSSLPSGLIYPIWGTDHYFRSSLLNDCIYKVFYYLSKL